MYLNIKACCLSSCNLASVGNTCLSSWSSAPIPRDFHRRFWFFGYSFLHCRDSWDYRNKEQTQDCVLDCVYGHWQGERGGQRFILKKWIQRLIKGSSSTSLSATSVGPLSLWARSKRCQFFWQYSTAFWACKILKQKQIDDCFYCYVFKTNLKN